MRDYEGEVGRRGRGGIGEEEYYRYSYGSGDLGKMVWVGDESKGFVLRVKVRDGENIIEWGWG